VERAAQLSGSTLSGWAVPALVGAARREVASAAVTTLAPAAWDEFVAALDRPRDPRTADLLARRPVWAGGAA
jgi:uncharacterized protein (DUF1778 family)